MHTMIVIAIGFAVLGICAITGGAVGGAHGIANAALAFLPLWLIGAGPNLYIGVRKAGYSFKDEAPVFVVIFAVPAAAALYVWWKFR
jgi:hypothetical protein